MSYQTLIAPEILANYIHDPDWVIVDCRFQLGDTEAGRLAYEQGHIPTAVYAHLDEDLSGPPATDKGRHPLPTPAALTNLFSRLGIDDTVQVVVYDDANGMVASRLWWMLRYMGHERVAVLDGGWSAWQAAHLPIALGTEQISPKLFTGHARYDWLVQIDEVATLPLLIDSRAPARYRGEVEPLDAAAGHIPRAQNYFFQENWGRDGRYLPPPQLQAQFEMLLGNTPPHDATFYCGSGVSACVNLLALAHAGLGNGRLYVGSWSEWSRSDKAIERSI